MSTDVTAAWLAEQADVSLQRLLPAARGVPHGELRVTGWRSSAA